MVLRGAGFDVELTRHAEAALDRAALRPPDAAIVELALPDGDGAEVCRRLHEWSSMALIVVSAVDDEHEKVRALDAGADDYVTKPFGMDELLARIRAALRRAAAAKTEGAAPVLEVGDFRVDLENRSVAVKGSTVYLTPKEYDLMVYLVSHPGKVLTHRTLLTSIWGGDSAEQTEYLRVFVGQLRKKVEPDTAAPRYILTEPWIGYRFDPGS